MRLATFTELRRHAREFFDLVEGGETVRVMRRGKPIADIVPTQGELPSWKRRPSQPLDLGAISGSAMILDERSE